MTDIPAPLPLEEQLCFAVYAAAHAFGQTYRPLLEPHGLTYPQYLVLLQLWEGDDRSVRELGERLFLDSGTLTPLLKRMEAAGWVTRQRDARDARIVRIRLTPKGEALRPVAAAIPGVLRCAAGLPAAELAQLRDTLRLLASRLREAEVAAPGPMAAG
ncbi:MarR family winged helix-turn-helix transcriptional regulator [Pseudoroseomonas cervicalis]|uniref:MarR family winged helix-turn-helix transcriptional regulator n=1 Tax=Teichococcus cervicalis TaxID=204525 RepID=UPI0027801CBE|nr:MarR family transcriptional regulator [Pseudoroseomonas cervicalis]MDQ1078960.1 DNA-binding MarR family transcriptional regulator [Pseudoroseomonas cervicalis]